MCIYANSLYIECKLLQSYLQRHSRGMDDYLGDDNNPLEQYMAYDTKLVDIGSLVLN